MKVKGFGKKYFTLASIQASSTAIKLNSICIAFKTKINQKLQLCSQSDIDEAPKDLVLLLLSSSNNINKHSNFDCFFEDKTALIVRLFRFIPRCPYYTTYFAFRRTGVHPPLSTF